MTPRLSEHARARLQQRGITSSLLELLLTYGRTEHDKKGGKLLYFDHRARRRLRRLAGETTFRKIEPKLGAYVVILSDGLILTAGYRTRRIMRC